MSFGFGAADLKGVLKLSKWLWDNCFDKDGTAGNVARRPLLRMLARALRF